MRYGRHCSQPVTRLPPAPAGPVTQGQGLRMTK